MTQTYTQIQKQIATLAREAEKLKRKEVDGVVAKIKQAIATYGLTAADLGLGSKRVQKARAAKSPKKSGNGKYSRSVKYRDSAGNTWVGRGPRPQWLRDALAAGKQLEDFAA